VDFHYAGRELARRLGRTMSLDAVEHLEFINDHPNWFASVVSAINSVRVRANEIVREETALANRNPVNLAAHCLVRWDHLRLHLAGVNRTRWTQVTIMETECKSKVAIMETKYAAAI
jgi:hypothetical protein